ncbi:hypothetical protein LEMLEM_LOCUS1957 [Lemmus lemmus]
MIQSTQEGLNQYLVRKPGDFVTAGSGFGCFLSLFWIEKCSGVTFPTELRRTAGSQEEPCKREELAAVVKEFHAVWDILQTHYVVEDDLQLLSWSTGLQLASSWTCFNTAGRIQGPPRPSSQHKGDVCAPEAEGGWSL